MVVRWIFDQRIMVNKLGAVRDHAAVIGKTILSRDVGHGVVGGGVLWPD